MKPACGMRSVEIPSGLSKKNRILNIYIQASIVRELSINLFAAIERIISPGVLRRGGANASSAIFVDHEVR